VSGPTTPTREADLPETTIDIRITIARDGTVHVANPDIHEEADQPLVVRQVDNFLPRLGEKHKSMLRAFIDQDERFTFDDIAHATGETYEAIKMRYFNLGRTTKAVTTATGEDFVLLQDVDYVLHPDGDRTAYVVPEPLLAELRTREI